MLFLVANSVDASGASLTKVVLVVFEIFVSKPSAVRVYALPDTLSTVWDAKGRIPWVDDVALVPCWTVQRLVSVLCGAAGLGLQNLFRPIQ